MTRDARHVLAAIAIAAGAACAPSTPRAPRAAPPVHAAQAPERAASAGSDRDAPAAPPPPSTTKARAAAERAWSELVAQKLVNPAPNELRIEPDAEPTCTEGVCHVRFVVSEADAERHEIGLLWVDASTNQVSWQPNDGRTKRWEIAAYARYVRDRSRAESAVAALSDVRSYCKKLETVHKLHCLIWVDEAPEASDCVPDGSVHDDCLWSVYVGEAHATHSSRMSTFYVDVRSETVIAAAPLDCDRMSLASWRSRQKASARNPQNPPPCPTAP